MKTSFLLLVATSTFVACGPTPAEIVAREKAYSDSLEKAEEYHIAMQKDIQDSIILFHEDQLSLKQQLIYLKSQYDKSALVLQKLKIKEKPLQSDALIENLEQLKLRIIETEKQIVN